MPATAALSVSTAIAPSSAPAPASGARGNADAGRAFDSHLDAARQQQDSRTASASGQADSTTRSSDRTDRSADGSNRASDRTDGPADADSNPAQPNESAPGKNTPPTADATAGDAPPAEPKADHDDGTAGDASSVAGAMLALLGQAAPAAASIATGGAAKVMAACVLKVSLGKPAADAPLATPGELAGTDADDVAVGLAGAEAPATKEASALADVFAAGLSRVNAHKTLDDHALQDLAPLAAATPQPTGNTGVMPPHALHIASPAGSAGFAQELGQQVAWLGGQDIKQAKIRLHPEELGQLDVKVSVQHTGQVDVTFAAQHPAAVHALQQTLPQLDALLAQHGLSLGQANVGQQQSGGDGRSGSGSGQGAVDGVDATDTVSERAATISAVGLLDAFA